VQLRDVWASSDEGRTWTQVCQTAQWEGRQGHATVVLDGHVYLMGGFGGSSRFNDLWKSTDCGKGHFFFNLPLRFKEKGLRFNFIFIFPNLFKSC
jgi:hypothetical protein